MPTAERTTEPAGRWDTLDKELAFFPAIRERHLPDPGYAAGPAPDADFAKETVVRPAKAKAPRAVQKRRA